MAALPNPSGLRYFDNTNNTPAPYGVNVDFNKESQDFWIGYDAESGKLCITNFDRTTTIVCFSAGSGGADVMTVALKPTQIFSLGMVAPDDWAGDFVATDASMLNVNGRSMAGVFGFINNTDQTIVATLWNVTDDIAVPGVPPANIANTGVEITVGLTSNPTPAMIGKQLGVKFSTVLPATGTYQITTGGLGIADILVNTLVGPATLFPFISANATPSNGLNYVSKSSIGILNGLSTQTFSADVVAFHQGTTGFQETTDNFGGLTLTEANANVAPTLATATTIKSDVGMKVTALAFAPALAAGRLVFLFSNEQFVAGF